MVQKTDKVPISAQSRVITRSDLEVNVLVSSGIDFVNTPRLYSDRATR